MVHRFQRLFRRLRPTYQPIPIQISYNHRKYTRNQNPFSLLCPAIVSLTDDNRKATRKNKEFTSSFKLPLISEIENTCITLQKLRNTENEQITKKVNAVIHPVLTSTFMPHFDFSHVILSYFLFTGSFSNFCWFSSLN